MYSTLSDFILSFFNIEDDEKWSEIDYNLRVILHLTITYGMMIFVGVMFDCLFEIITCSIIYNIVKQRIDMWDSSSLERCSVISTVLFLNVALFAKVLSTYLIKFISCIISTLIIILLTTSKYGRKFLGFLDKLLTIG